MDTPTPPTVSGTSLNSDWHSVTHHRMFQQLPLRKDALHVSLHSLSTLRKMCFHKLLVLSAQHVHNRLNRTQRWQSNSLRPHSTTSLSSSASVSETSKKSNTELRKRQNLSQSPPRPPAPFYIWTARLLKMQITSSPSQLKVLPCGRECESISGQSKCQASCRAMRAQGTRDYKYPVLWGWTETA